MKKYIFTIWLSLFCLVATAQTDKFILLKKANNMRARRQYEKEITLYSDWLETHPQDRDIAGKLIESYLIVSKFGKAENLLREKREILLPEEKVKYGILINLKKGKHKEAFKSASVFLEDNENIYKYGQIAMLFERNRNYEYAEKLMLKARAKANDEQLYAHELGNNYFFQEKYRESINEFIGMLEKDEKYYNLVSSKIKQMLAIDESLIEIVRKATHESSRNKIKEIYGNALADIGDYEKALEEYNSLSDSNLLHFAAKLKSEGKYKVAKLAYYQFIERPHDALKQADVKLEIAIIAIMQNDLLEAEKVLLQIYHDEEIAAKRNAFRISANRYSRELLAEIALRKQDSNAKVLKYLEEAKSFCPNQMHKQEVDLKITNILLMSGKFDDAIARIQTGYEKNDFGSNTYKEILMLDYLVATMQGDAKADSLLGEVIISSLGNEKTNDALFLKVIAGNFYEKVRMKFFQAYRLQNIYRTEQAVNILQEIYNENKDEIMLILAGEWSQQMGNIEAATEYYQHEFSDIDLQEYAKLKLVEINNDQKEIVEFLQEKPNSVFSSKFRLLYKE
ncbi:MAG: hypothetical protein KAS49_02030 [Candidatus Cloacimonetes bacterium]|nr:hypothetical protein [Candidatus Cloacimonadota bacterium]